MTKEEILNSYTLNFSPSIPEGQLTERVSSAMEEYAKQTSIGFAKFAMEHTLQDINIDNDWCYETEFGKYENLTDDQLYTVYIESLKK